MGGANKQYMERQEIGCRDHIKKYVCTRHFEDTGLVNYIKKCGDYQPCDYCEEEDIDEDDEVISILLPNLVEQMLKCIKTEYGDPENWLGFDSTEDGDGYQGETFDTQELLIGELGLEIDNEQVLDDIIELIICENWCVNDPYGNSESEELLFTWRNFSNILKHRSRFVFFKSSFKSAGDLLEPFEILDKIGEAVHGMRNLYSTHDTLFSTFDFYRARQHKKKNEANEVDTLGPPPKESAMVNRMSPAGIPMFYCSDDSETAIAEVLNRKFKNYKYLTVGCFQNTRALNIINLNNLKTVSIFESDKNKYYHATQFLLRFRHEITMPVSRNGAEHYEYVPTQVVTEYFRDIFSDVYKIKIDGIQYPSVKNPRKSCFVLFFDQGDVSDSKTSIRKKSGFIKDHKKPSLMLNKKSIKTFIWK